MPSEDQAEAEFAAWVRPHLTAMAHLAGRMVPPGDRDDVVQEALVRAWRRRTTYDASRGSALTWLLAIVADRSRRHRSRKTSRLLSVPTESGSQGSDIDLERAIAALAPRQRMAIDLYYFVGLDVTECAAVMDCADGTVKATLHQSRQRLRDLLGEDYEGELR